jgi:anaerobic selenocysteine-containing dehydrogenase
MASFGRRGFLGGAGLLTSIAAGCRPRRDPYALVKPPVPVAQGLRSGSETYVLSTCGMCLAGCGIRVRVVEGRAVKIEGNPDSPVNRGGLCARGQAGIQMLYHPARIRRPMRRVGERGGNHWQALTWDDAIALVASELSMLRAAGEPQALVLLDGLRTGAMHALWARFMEAFGSPNHIGHGATGFGAMVQAIRTMTGTSGMPGYDFGGSRCVLLVGTGALESSPQWIHLARAMAGDARPRLLCASPRLPSTAVLVDEWIPVAPGGAAPFLLGLLHVLLREQLGDESVLESVRGFVPWTDAKGILHPGLREQVMAEYAPDKIEARTGIPSRRIEELAREIVAMRPSVVAVDEEVSDRAAASAGLLVNAILSSLDVPGGMLFDTGVDPFRFDVAVGDSTAMIGLRAPCMDGRASSQREVIFSRILSLPEAILSGKPYPTKALFLDHSNPIVSKPGGVLWREAIAKVPFVVSFSPILDESVQSADLVLPDRTFLENWDILSPGYGMRALSLRQPVVRPLGDAMQTGDFVLRLGREIGGSVAAAFPWNSYQEAVLSRLASLKGGPDGILAELESKGVWLDPVTQKDRGDDNDEPTLPSSLGVKPILVDVTNGLFKGPIPTTADPIRFPLVLLPYRGPGYAEGGLRHIPWLGELPVAAGDPWPERVEMSLQDAQKLGVEEGDRVIVESVVARVELRAQVRSGIRPGVIALRLGGGPRMIGPGIATAASLLANIVDEETGLWFACATLAQIRKVL